MAVATEADMAAVMVAVMVVVTPTLAVATDMVADIFTAAVILPASTMVAAEGLPGMAGEVLAGEASKPLQSVPAMSEAR